MDVEKAALAASDSFASDSFASDQATIPPEDSAVVPDDEAIARDPIKQKKIHEIETACEKHDITQLRRLAETAGGFLSDHVRRRACKCKRKSFHARCMLITPY